MYKVKLDKRVQKRLRGLSKDHYLRSAAAIDNLEDFPKKGDLKLLKGKYKGMFRLRVGSFRILFQVNKEAEEISIFKFDTRGDIY